MARTDGGAAFPHEGLLNEGLSLRDYFAAAALQGFAAAGHDSTTGSHVAVQCYLLADELLKYRSSGL